MKAIPTFILLAGLSATIPGIAAEPPASLPPPVAAPAVSLAAAPTGTAPALTKAAPAEPAAAAAPAAMDAASPGSPPAAAPPPGEPAPPAGTETGGLGQAGLAKPMDPIPAQPGANPAAGLRLNFRNVPLDMVLNYLSDAAGFIIVVETKLQGNVDVWSNQPLSKDEAVDLLNSVLNKNGYAAIRNGRMLTIVDRDEAKKRDIPVKVGNKPEEIPKNEEMVTQIIPVRYANAVQMTKDLTPLLPTFANLTANESGNALVLTDVQSDIRRMVEIVRALDTSISGISGIRVFPLRYADAKDLAIIVKELFPAQNTGTSARGGNNFNPFMARFGGRGGPGGGGTGTDSGTGVSEARQAASRVTAVADERTNSLVVSAPEEVIPTIEQLVKEVDTNAENITELRVFHLVNSDPQEMADTLTSVFPDSTKTDDTRSSVRFGGRGGFPFPGMNGGNNQSTESSRAQQKGKVTAVADMRTSSVIVSAASDLMPQIAAMIAQLDSSPAKKQRVYVYSLENAEVDQVQQVLQDMFERNSTSRNNRSSTTQNNALSNRSRNQQNTSGTSSGFGSGTTRRTGATQGGF